MISVFKLQTPQIWDVPTCKCVYLLNVRNGIFRLRNVQIRATPSCKRVDFLKLRNYVFRVRSAEIWAVLSSNEVDLLMLRNSVFKLRKVEIWACCPATISICDSQESRIQSANVSKWGVLSRKGVDLLMFRNRLFMLRKVQMCAVPS